MDESTPARSRYVIYVGRDHSALAALAGRIGSARAEAARRTGPESGGLVVDSAAGVVAALGMLRRALGDGRPYSVAFIDLPSTGPDGASELVSRFWAEDEDLQIVLCAPSESEGGVEGEGDRAIAGLAGAPPQLDAGDRVVVLRTPFDGADARRLARALAGKSDLARRARFELSELERAVERRTLELRRANETLQHEITERKAIEDQLRHHAFHDTLTGLANRSLLTDRLERCIARAQRQPDYRLAVLFLDIDNFKVINDSLGHELGDELLVRVAQRLGSVLRHDENLAARLGGDEFVILLEGIGHARDAAAVSERILERLSHPFELGGQEVVISASIGVAIGDASYTGADALLRDADIAMYRAKEAGKARYAMFSRVMHDQAIERLRIEGDLRRAVEQGQFELVYQPIVALPSTRIRGVEALVRWEHPERGRVSPDDFIPIAEETGLIVPLGRWVLGEACRQLQRWDESDSGMPKLCMNVNLSRRQLLETGVVQDVARNLLECGIEGSRLNLEITESAVIEDADAAAAQLAQIKRLGVGIQMDDFGTGYSSLSCLHRFPLDVVKIDRSFMATMEQNRNYAAIIHGIIDIAHNLNMRVTAEGVETQTQMAQILALDCDFAQGYLFSGPLSAPELEALIRSEKRWVVTA